MLANRGIEIPERDVEHPGRLVRAELIVPLVGVPSLARVLGVRCGEAVAASIQISEDSPYIVERIAHSFERPAFHSRRFLHCSSFLPIRTSAIRPGRADTHRPAAGIYVPRKGGS